MKIPRKLKNRLQMLLMLGTFLLGVRAVSGPVQPIQQRESIPLTPKTVYLTFDDGPSRNTEAILKVLEEEGVQATFFVTLRDREEFPEAYREITDRGHTLALHCSDHDYERLYRSSGAYLADLSHLTEELDKMGVPYEKLVRLPGGSLNGLASPRTLESIVHRLLADGYSCFDWNVTSGDDGEDGSPLPVPAEEIAEQVARRSEGMLTPVVLLHDSYPFSTTPEATRQIIHAFREKGYSFEVLTAESQPILFHDLWEGLTRR